MRFSILVATLALMVQAGSAFAGDGDKAVPGEQGGEVIQRRRGPAPEPQEQAPPPGAAAGEEDGYYDEGGAEPPPPQTRIQRREVEVENRDFVGGVEGEYYGPGYGGLPQNWSQGICQTVGDGFDQFGGPLVNIVGVDRFGRSYRLLPVPIPVGPARINLVLAFNGLITNGVCPGPILPVPYIQPQWNFRPPVFQPYVGQVRPPMPLYGYNPRIQQGPRVYRPMPGYGRGGVNAAPPMRQFARPPGY